MNRIEGRLGAGAVVRRLKRWAPAALAIVAGAASAQGVSISGRLDAGLQYVDDGVSKQKRVDNGTASGSRLIFEGTEDLGGGLSALFYLQHRFAVDTGTATSAAKFWNFGSYVGLSGKQFGTLTLGRQYVPIFWSMFAADDSGTLKLHNYGVVQSLQRGTTLRVAAAASPIKSAGSLDSIAGGIHSLAIATSLEDNIVVYKTPSIGGATASLAVGAPEGYAAGSGKVFGGNVEYRSGGFYGSLAANSKEGRVPAGGAVGQKLRDYLASALYAVTPEFKLWGNVHPWKLESQGVALKGRDYMLGVSYLLPQGQAWMSYGDKRADPCSACGSKAFGIGYHHLLSKRTQLYVAYGRIRNQANAANSLNGINPGLIGKSVQGTAAGIVTLF